jgi:putative hydrolase of the HAD superfamily
VIRAVTFDAAGTLIAPREPVGRTYARLAGEVGIVADPITVDAAFRTAFRQAPPLAFPALPASARAAAERQWWRAVVHAALGAPPEDPAFATCFDGLFAHYARAAAWLVFPDVTPALMALRARGLRLGVVSNFDRRLPGLLDELGLGAAFDAIVWSTEAGAAKPAAAIFDAAAARLGIAVADMCHVGDDPETDLAGAERAGAVGVLLDRGARGPGSLCSLTGLAGRLGLGA